MEYSGGPPLALSRILCVPVWRPYVCGCMVSVMSHEWPEASFFGHAFFWVKSPPDEIPLMRSEPLPAACSVTTVCCEARPSLFGKAIRPFCVTSAPVSGATGPTPFPDTVELTCPFEVRNETWASNCPISLGLNPTTSVQEALGGSLRPLLALPHLPDDSEKALA